MSGAALVARRITSWRCAFEATMEYRPRGFQHLAGVTASHNSRSWYFLHVTAGDRGRAVLRVAAADRGAVTVDEAGREPLGDAARLRLGLGLRGTRLRFRYDTGPGRRTVGPLLDASVLSDEHAEEFTDGQSRSLGFTGAFAGPRARDLTGGGLPADFDEAVFHDDALHAGGSGHEGAASPG
ncbi:hypothetical protein [Streptomyces sp. enrichment culture]|uniref:beta-xylosidase family glycoside hydrolase n=1 Tax=Streptomyces sp. enrichment culture TaxID=1795815 RepID=UPI003F54497A